MLARANRVVRAEDFRATVRKGARVSTEHALLYVRASTPESPTRYGFIVSKAVGNAVSRNLVRRRLRAIGRELLSANGSGRDIVIRAREGISDISWASLHKEISEGVERSGGKR